MAIANVANKSRGEKAMASQFAADYKASRRIEASAAKSDNNQKLIFVLLLLLFDAILVSLIIAYVPCEINHPNLFLCVVLVGGGEWGWPLTLRHGNRCADGWDFGIGGEREGVGCRGGVEGSREWIVVLARKQIDWEQGEGREQRREEEEEGGRELCRRQTEEEGEREGWRRF
ncbi:hypothetical protein Ancab_016797 [Ancistrocladus abbreviatus]